MAWKSGFVLMIFFSATFIHLYGQSTESLDSLLMDWKNDSQLKPGVAIAAIKGEEIILKRNVGYENLEDSITVSANTVFDLASLSKQFTGFAIAKLITEGKLSIEDNVKEYMPELEKLNNGLQIKHLIYHTSGLREVENEFSLGGHGCLYSTDKALAILKNQNLKSKPGKKFKYSNTNYLLLAIIVERITGMAFQDWSKENIFLPLGMENTFVNYHPCVAVEHQAKSYYRESEEFVFHENYGISMIGSSSVYSNLKDMTKWMLALQNETTFPEVFKLMKKKGSLDDGVELNQGFGLSIMVNPMKLLVVNHMGFTRAGFRTLIASFPNEQFSFLVLTNWGDINPDQFSDVIIAYCKTR